MPHPWLTQPNAQIPIGLLYLAAVLDRADIRADVFNFSDGTDKSAIERLPKCDVYGITVTSLELLQANRFAKKIKEKYPYSKIWLGGPGTISNEFVDWNVIDKICIGDGERSILDMVYDTKRPNQIQTQTYESKPVHDLDDIPFPARDKLSNLGGNIFAYNKQYDGAGGSTVLLTSRGCPFSCAFCASPYVCRKYQYRSTENVMAEVDEIIQKYNIRQIRVSDDMFTANITRALELSKEMGKRDVSWRISTRVKPFTSELAEGLVAGGCKEVSFGIESFDNHVLNVLKKGTNAYDNINAMRTAKEAGLTVRLLFMINTPGQRPETIEINIKCLEEYDGYYDIIACTTFIPIPGCDIWYHPERYGVEILNKNLDDYNFYFFSDGKENPLKDVIKLKGRTLEDVSLESEIFRQYLLTTGKVNKG